MDKVQDAPTQDGATEDGSSWTTELADLAATKELGGRLAGVLRGGDRIVLEGDLGAGKTELVRAILRALGVPEEVAVTSPTFGLVHEYPLGSGSVPLVVHADLYRINSEPEADELGLLELLDEESIGFVEWGERFSGLLNPHLTLRLALVAPSEGALSSGARGLRAQAHGDRGRAILSGLKRPD